MENTITLNKYIWIKKIDDDIYNIYNKKSKTNYQFRENEVNVILSMEKPVTMDELADINKSRMSKERLEKFVALIDRLGFLESSTIRSTNTLTSYKIGIGNPSKYINENNTFVKCFATLTPYVAVGIFCVALLTSVLTGTNLFELKGTFQFNAQNIIISVIILFVCTTIHEFAHAFFLIRYGMPVPEIGIMMIWFSPAAYADVSCLDFLDEKYKKVQVLMAGIYVHVFFAGLGLLLLSVFPGTVWLSAPLIALNIVFIITNVAFFINLDGYYLLTVLTDEPMLREKTVLFLRRAKNPPLRVDRDIMSRAVYFVIGFAMFAGIPALLLTGVSFLIGLISGFL